MRLPATLLSVVASPALAAAAAGIERDYGSSDWWIVYFTALLSLFTLGLMLYTARLWKATVKLSADAEANAVQQRDDTVRALETSERAAAAAEQSARVAGHALSLAQRAFVFWKGFNCGPHLWDSRVKEYVVFADAENVGVTPALDVRVTVRVQVVRGSSAEPPVFTPDTSGPSTVMGPKTSIRSAFLTVAIADLIECWEQRCDIYVWCHVVYRDIFNPDLAHHHQTCAKLQLIHEPTTVPPEGHAPYIQFMSFGRQNDAA